MLAGCLGAEGQWGVRHRGGVTRNSGAWNANISIEGGFDPRAVRRLSELAEPDFECRLGAILGRVTLLNSAPARLATIIFLWGSPMFDLAMTALLRAVLDEVCEDISRYETGARTHVASRILEAATNGDTSPERLKEVGREALHGAPTM